LRFAGVRASPRRVRRVMRENGLLAPHRVGRTEGVRVIAKRFGVDPNTVQRIAHPRPFASASVAA
jgi:hypothetical protein